MRTPLTTLTLCASILLHVTLAPPARAGVLPWEVHLLSDNAEEFCLDPSSGYYLASLADLPDIKDALVAGTFSASTPGVVDFVALVAVGADDRGYYQGYATVPEGDPDPSDYFFVSHWAFNWDHPSVLDAVTVFAFEGIINSPGETVYSIVASSSSGGVARPGTLLDYGVGGPPASAGAVPEPATALLALCGVALLLRRKRGAM